MHNTLKRNTPIKIINPENSKVIDTKIFKRADYPNNYLSYCQRTYFTRR